MKSLNKYLKYVFSKNFWIFLGNYWLATMEMVTQNYNKAIKHFDKCLKIDGDIDNSGLVFEHLGKCYFGINDIKKAKFFLLKSLEIKSSQEEINSEVSSRLGFIFYQENDYKKAKYYLEEAINNYKKIDYTNIKMVKKYLANLEVYNKNPDSLC
jgi:tetratricopeptide (TPR) repeat protein